MILLFLLLLQAQDPGFTLIEKGPNGPRDAVEKAITDAAAWAAFWKSYRGDKAVPPAVDFAKEDVILVAWGEKPSTGYTIEVVRVERDKAETRVRVRRTKPEGPVGTVLTQPSCIVRIPKITGTLRFVDTPEKN